MYVIYYTFVINIEAFPFPFCVKNARWYCRKLSAYGPLVRYVKLRVAHAPGMYFPPPRNSDPDMHHGVCDACAMMHAGIAN